MRTVIGVIACMGLVSGIAAQDDKPNEKYVSKEGKFTAVFPGKPMTISKQAGGVDLHIAIVEKGMGGFAIIHSDLPAGAVKAAKPKELLDGGQKGLIDNFKAKITSSKDFEFGKQKYPAANWSAPRTPSTSAFRSSWPVTASIRSSWWARRTW